MLKITSLILTIVTVSFYAQSSDKIQLSPSTQILMKKLDNEAQTLNITPSKYKHALDQFMRLQTGAANPDIDQLLDRPDMVNYESLSENELQKIINEQKSNFASYLGLPVSKLDNFISIVGNDIENESNTGISIFAVKDNTEKVRVYCKDACGTNTNSNTSIFLSLQIHSLAVDAGISQYERFQVDFVNSDNDVVKQEEWKYNNFSGAWRESVISMPCLTCSYN